MPSASTASIPAAATAPPTCRRSSQDNNRTAAGPHAGRRHARLAHRGDERLPAADCRAQVHPRRPLQRQRRVRADAVEHHASIGGVLPVEPDAPAGSTYSNASSASRRPAVPPPPDDAQAALAGHADGRRRRPVGRGDLHRQVRPRQGAVPLGPPGQEGRQQLVLGARRPRPGPASSGAHRTSRGSARRSSSPSRRATPTGRSSSAASTTPSRCRPYTLPRQQDAERHQVAAASRAAAADFNELRFEDKKDSEEIYFHAQKDYNRVVENNEALKVGTPTKAEDDDETTRFATDRTETVKNGTRR